MKNADFPSPIHKDLIQLSRPVGASELMFYKLSG